VTFVTGGAAPFGPALIEKFMEKVRKQNISGTKKVDAIVKVPKLS
jgi:hypothetical protein